MIKYYQEIKIMWNIKLLDFLLKMIKSTGISFEFVDLGGGFGIPYNKKDKIIDIRNYAKLVQTFKNKLNC